MQRDTQIFIHLIFWLFLPDASLHNRIGAMGSIGGLSPGGSIAVCPLILRLRFWVAGIPNSGRTADMLHSSAL